MKILLSLMVFGVGARALAQEAPSWPRTLTVDKGTVVFYQPQLEKLEGRTLSGRAALSWEARGAAPAFGVLWFETQVMFDKDAREAQFEGFKVTKVRFPNSKPEQEQALARLLETEVPKWDLRSSFDEIQDAVAVTQREVERSERALRMVPPKFIFSNEPAVLLLYDGQPVTRPLQDTNLERVVNTPMFVMRDPTTQRFYLNGGALWYESAAALGPFQPVAAPSPGVQAFVAKNPLPPPQKPPEGDASSDPQGSDSAPKIAPKIFVATEPTELIQFNGAPNFVPVGENAELLYADNCDGKVAVVAATGETFVIASGRWFKAKSLDGPWTPVRPDQLPPAFANIPADSVAAPLLPFVPGTTEADDAVADAQIPQTAAVKRDQKITVTYDGDPRFELIAGTEIRYATNTQSSVIWDSGAYWCCDQAVWYMAPSATGPWVVSDRRPPSIDKIQPSAPIYNVRYVYVYQSAPEVVYVGYLPGYVGVYPYYGTVIYGTGYYYPPYIGASYYYRAYPVTYGVSMTYSPYMGWGVGASYCTAFLAVGFFYGAARWGYGYGYYGPGGYRYPPYPAYGYRPPPAGYRPPYYGGSPGYRPPTGGTPGGGHPVTPVQPGGGGGHPVTPVAPGGGGAGAGQRPSTGQLPAGGGAGSGQRPSTGQLPAGGGAGSGQRPSAGQLPAGGGAGSGQRPSAGQLPAGGGAGSGQRPSTGNIYNRPENAARNAPRDMAAGNRASPSPSNRPNNVYGDRSGNVYRQNQGGNWDRNTGGGWKSQGASPSQQPRGGSAATQPSRGSAPSGLGNDAAARNRGGGGSYGGGGRSGGSRGGGHGGGGGRGGGGRR